MHGFELWKTDVSSDGTVLIKDIEEGPSGSFPGSLTALNGRLVFRASSNQVGGDDELWVSDGTVQGTTIVADIHPGIDDGGVQSFLSPVLNGKVYFTGFTDRPALWTSDGTLEGTTMVTDSVSIAKRTLTIVLNDKIIFTSNEENSERGAELWVSDGSAQGTTLLKDIAPGGDSSDPRFGFVTGNRAIFFAEGPAAGRELWSTDGTTKGTRLIKDFVPGIDGTQRVGYAIEYGDGIIISVRKEGLEEVWYVDVRTGSSFLIESFVNTRPLSARDPIVQARVVGGSSIVMSGSSENEGIELWRISLPDDASNNQQDDRTPSVSPTSFDESPSPSSEEEETIPPTFIDSAPNRRARKEAALAAFITCLLLPYVLYV